MRLRTRDVLLAVPLGAVAAVFVDVLRHPVHAGVVSWASLAVSAGALALYLGLQLWGYR